MIKTRVTSKKTLRIAAATSVTIFSLVAVFAASMAWFTTSMNDISGKGFSIKVGQLSGRLEYVEFHDYDSIDTSAAKLYKFEKDPFFTITYDWATGAATSSGSSTFVMDNYSSLVQEHPLLVIFAFNTEYTSIVEDDIYIRGVTKITDFLGKVENGYPKYPLGPGNSPAYISTKNGHDYYASSSIVNFRSKSLTTEEYDALVAEGNTTIDIPDSSVSTYENFVKIDKNNPENVTFKQKPTIFSSVPGEKVHYIATIVNYYPEAISMIYSTYLGDTILEDTYQGDLYFACDWSLEVF